MTEERFIRKGYKIWDNWEDEEVYELSYRHEVYDMCNIMNGLNDAYNNLKKENKKLKQKIRELEVENESQSDAIDGLQEFIAHNGMED